MAVATYSRDNTKQRFIYDRLLSELLGSVRTSSLQASRVARMKIFPYVASDGTIKITSLVDGKMPWFYLNDGSIKYTSRGSYRILADDVLSPDLKSKIVSVLKDYIREYDARVVIRDIIRQMQSERDYTSVWWAKATEIFEIWDGSNASSADYKDASANIENDYFLFRSSYCDPRFSKLLLSYGVFKDILRHPNSSLFFKYAKAYPSKDSQTLLQLLGVPTNFVVSNSECSTYLRRLFLGIRDHVYFPLSDITDQERELCELSHYVVFSVIQPENHLAFRMLLNNETYQDGIVVRNRRNSYIPISYSIFYQPVPMNGQERIAMTDDILESIHIDERAYETENARNNAYFWQAIHAHPFDGTIQFAPNYHFGNIRVSEGHFYRWIWHYLPDVSTARLILGWLTNRGRSFVDDRDRPLTMDVIRMIRSAPPMDSDRSFRFRLGTSIKDAVRDADIINALAVSPTLQNIHIVINDSVEKYESIQLKAKITRAIVAKPAVVSMIQKDEIWDNIFITDALRENKYIIAWSESEINIDLADEQILMVSSESVEKCVLQYIGKRHHIDVSKIDLSGKNYQRDFRDLVFDIRMFISSPREYTSVPVVDNSIIPLRDMVSADDEIKLWHVLKTSREVIWNSDKPSPNTDYNVFSLDNFLRAKYLGHCQICGKVIPKNVPEDQYEFMLADKTGNTFAHALHNLLCLCPTCHSDLRMGYGKRDLSSVARVANQYISCMEQIDDHTQSAGKGSIISQFANRRRFSEGFSDPIVCEICANGKEERIFFSWEHFMRIALVFYNPEQDYQYSGQIGNLMQLLRMLAN